jgi:hypothetical protein
MALKTAPEMGNLERPPKNSIVICWCAFRVYRVLFDARATNSSNLDSKSLRIGDWFDFL